MKKIRNHSALLSKYTLMYEKKPRSRVFAPLAETYRKLGMIDEAMKILNSGIKNHPSYTLGYIVLANCYYDLQNYEMAYNTIRPFVSQNLENITMQKLFAKTCINLGHLEEALQTFKYLLLLNPKDTNVADQIKLLEDDLLVDNEVEEIETKNTSSSFDEDEWVQVDFNKVETEDSSEDIDDWNVGGTSSPLDAFKQEIEKNSIDVKEHTLDDEYFHEDYDNESRDVLLPENEVAKEEDLDSSKPIITHTLVDLYCKQGHLAQAASILENILELHPDDEATKKRLDEITMMLVEEAAIDHFPQEELINPNLQQVEEELVENSEVKENKLEKIQSVFEKFQLRINQISNERLSSI